MYLQTQGAERPKLSLAFAGKIPNQPPLERGSPTLSGHELRRIVSEIIG